MKIERIETDRLYLRCFTPADADFAISIWNDPEMGEYLLDGDKSTGERIGTCSFIPQGEVYDIAYCVHKSRWRQGYATEMVAGMIGYAKRQGAKKVTVVVSSENPGSNAVVRKFGFQLAETLMEKKRGSGREFTDYKYELDL